MEHSPCEILTSPREAVSVEDTQLVPKLVLQDSPQRQQHKFLLLRVARVGHVHIVLLPVWAAGAQGDTNSRRDTCDTAHAGPWT